MKISTAAKWSISFFDADSKLQREERWERAARKKANEIPHINRRDHTTADCSPTADEEMTSIRAARFMIAKLWFMLLDFEVGCVAQKPFTSHRSDMQE